jgi:hypothetical protein
MNAVFQSRDRASIRSGHMVKYEIVCIVDILSAFFGIMKLFTTCILNMCLCGIVLSRFPTSISYR